VLSGKWRLNIAQILMSDELTSHIFA